MKLITSKFPGKCRTCKSPHATGDSVYWDRAQRGVQCVKCGGGTNPAPTPSRPTTPRTAPNPSTPDVPTVYSHYFPSWLAYVDQAENGTSAMRSYSRHSITNDHSFTMTDSMSEAVTLARTGWQSELPNVSALTDSLLKSLRPSLHDTFTTINDVVGCEVDVARFISGDPECMVEMIPAQISKPGRVISIHIGLSYSGGTSTTEVIRRGVAIIALVDILTQLQHSVEITGEMRTRGFGRTPQTSSITINLKSATEPLDVASLIFAVAHPSTLRRLGFSIKEQQSSRYRSEFHVGSSYGLPESIKDSTADIVLDNLAHMGDAATWILDNLKTIGLIGD